MWLYCEGVEGLEGAEPVQLLYTNNETNNQLLFDEKNVSEFSKDGINNYVVNDEATVNPAQIGTKAAAQYRLQVAAGATVTIRLRLCTLEIATEEALHAEFLTKTLQQARDDADCFYDAVTPEKVPDDQRLIVRQALAGMMWSKQFYNYDVKKWLGQHAEQHAETGGAVRNTDWGHMDNRDVISMPDKWEYPWYATWDSAFHTFALAQVDPEFAKNQLLLFLSDRYMHPNGMMPAYEWNFSDTNPPVHSTAVFGVYNIDKAARGTGDIAFLKRSFHKLNLNFTWWLNQKDVAGNNVFGGGFLGLDNIGVFDRSSPLPTGGHIEQSDGTAWMAIYAQSMLMIALELAQHDDVYEDMAIKYLDHFFRIADALRGDHDTAGSMWDEDDGMFYDVLRFPDGSATRLKVRSLVGLLPMCASVVIQDEVLQSLPNFQARLNQYDCDISTGSCVVEQRDTVGGKRHLLSVLGEKRLRLLMTRLFDENEFLSEFGIRSLSKYHQDNPYVFEWDGESHTVAYLPGESDSGMFGGNSNWRGPIWLPMNFLMLRSLMNIYTYYGREWTVEYPTGSGEQHHLKDILDDLSDRMIGLFARNGDDKRAVFGGAEKFQNDPQWRDHMLFYEYFHGDSGAGLGASHQTGWSGLIATIIVLFGKLVPGELLTDGSWAMSNALAKGTVDVGRAE